MKLGEEGEDYGTSVGDGNGLGVGHGGFSGSSGVGHGVGATVGDGVGVDVAAALTSISISLKLVPTAIAAITMIGSISILTRSDLIVYLPVKNLSVFDIDPPRIVDRNYHSHRI